jgi:hypothetical protein
MKTKKQYTAPALTVVTFKAEQGYAFSNGKTFSNIFDGNPLGDYNTFGQQKWMGVGEGGAISGNLFDAW